MSDPIVDTDKVRQYEQARYLSMVGQLTSEIAMLEAYVADLRTENASLRTTQTNDDPYQTPVNGWGRTEGASHAGQ